VEMSEVLQDVSVVVASRGRNAMLSNLLLSLDSMTPAIGEVVVVDDGSRVPVADSIVDKGWSFRLKIIRNDAPRGPAFARNQAVHRSRGRILLFTDDDCLVDPTWAGHLVAHLEKGPEGLGGVGGCVIAAGHDLFSRYYEFNRILDPRAHDSEHPSRIPYMVTANCGIRRETYMRAGGFDSDMKIAGGEDVALSLKISKLGLFFERDERAKVRHRFKPGLRSFWRTFFNYGRGGRYVMDRYLPL
jgi:glycosyltransferase involved in cell wall biosynthesis